MNDNIRSYLIKNFIYKSEKTVWPLGRPTSIHEVQRNFVGPHANELKQLGFNPFENISRSFNTFSKNPIKVSSLLSKRMLRLMEVYIFDREEVYFDPVLLSRSSYFSYGLGFYFLPFFIFGLIGFLLSGKDMVS